MLFLTISRSMKAVVLIIGLITPIYSFANETVPNVEERLAKAVEFGIEGISIAFLIWLFIDFIERLVCLYFCKEGDDYESK